jgi:hypothetical protein
MRAITLICHARDGAALASVKGDGRAPLEAVHKGINHAGIYFYLPFFYPYLPFFTHMSFAAISSVEVASTIMQAPPASPRSQIC